MENVFSSDYFDKSFNKSIPIDEGIELSNESKQQDININNSKYSLAPFKEFELQKLIRKLFKRTEQLNYGGIAKHPDFQELISNGLTKKQYTCAIFLDIKGSTRLSLFYNLDFIFKFKNAVIQTCIETIRAFDGYVHRIMGDAVLGFFGSSKISKEQAIIDALNCCITLRLILEKSIKPWLEKRKEGFNAADFGFRIGCNFGNDEEILWGNYGFRDIGEISPTGLPVDLTAKLQALANKNEIMIGQGIIDFISWPDDFSKIKTVQKNLKEEECPYIEPNYENINGHKLNYKMRILDYDKCLEVLPFDTHFKDNVIRIPRIKNNPNIRYQCFYKDKITGKFTRYISNSSFLAKNIDLEFKVTATISSTLKYPLTITYTKKNTGVNTPQEERDPIIRRFTLNKKTSTCNSYAEHILKESTLYRGIHTMSCEIRDIDNNVVFYDVISVLIL